MGLNNNILSKPISITDIKKCLGAASSDLGALCVHNNINIRSKHKPIRMSVYRPLTEAERAYRNYGHNFLSFNSPVLAIQSVVEGNNFEYVRPYGYYRMLDFDGYNHKTTDWYAYELMNNTADQQGSIRVTIDGVDEIFNLGALEGFTSSSPNIQFGWILSQSPFSESINGVHWYPLTGVLTIADLKNHNISLNNFATGTWYMYPALTTAQYTQKTLHYIADKDTLGSIDNWWPLPFSNIASFTVKNYIPPVSQLDNINVTWSGDVEYNGIDVVITSFNVLLTNNNDSDILITVSVKSKNSIPNNVPIGVSKTVTAVAGTTTIAKVLSSGNIGYQNLVDPARVVVTLQTQSATRELSLAITEK